MDNKVFWTTEIFYVNIIQNIYKKYITPLCKNVLPDKSKTMCVPYILKRWTEFNSGHGDVCTLN